jgi:class 3 adenylate cyclase/tetratricopeptide (TPR) repeat protein
MDIEAWLQGLGLERYFPAFRDNEIDWEVLRKLTSDDLKEIGVVAIGHRRKLLEAIAAIGVSVPAGLSAAPAPSEDAQRRQLTVMFCDLVGSMALSARLDPEDLRAVVGAYHRRVAAVIERAGGFVAKYMGDGVLAYFGYPRADEHDAERAVRAGLALVEEVPRLDTAVETRLHVRIGIATGLVVVGDLLGHGAAQEQAVVGETPNLAARLQALAEPGQVVIAASTRRLTGGLFDYEDLGAIEIKGLAMPIAAARVLRESRAEGRFEALRATRTPFVGRDEELALLQRRWQQAKSGEGCIVLLSGEPGIGKSRLAHALVERLAGQPHTRLRSFCSPHHPDSALYPAITQLERAAGFRREDTADERLDKLETLLAQATNDLGEAASLLAALLSLPTGERYPILDLTPQKQKERTLRALVAQVEGLAARQPVLMLFEDAQWSDPTSLELYDLIVDRVPALPVLLIITFRPEFSAPWAGRPHVTALALNRLSPRQRAEIIVGVTGGKTLPKEIADQIVDRTDGVPLFVEELTKAVVESGMLADAGDRYTAAGPVPALAIPASLQASLLARLDRLAPVRELAQIGAVLGRQFSHELISAVARMPPAHLDDALAQLVAAELIYCRGMPPDAEYTFKHALVQDAAYDTLLRSRRQQLHARIAQALEGKFQAVAEAQPELIAHHYAAAGLAAPAIDYYRRAAERAMAASANAEAIAHLTKGLELIDSLPESSEQMSREIDFRLALGHPLIATQGWGSVEAQAAFTRAKELCAAAGESPELFRSLVGLWVIHLVRPDLETASELSQELFNLAAKLGSDEYSLNAESVACVTCCDSGRFTSVPSHAARVRVLYDPVRHRGPNFLMLDPAMTALAFESRTLWCLGYPERASERGLAALSMGETVAHPLSLCMALREEAMLRIMRREPELIAARTKPYLAIAREHGFAYDCALGSMLEIWQDAWTTGQCADDRMDVFRSSLADLRMMGIQLGLGWYHVMFAECLEKQGDTDEALKALEAAVTHFERRGRDALWEPEVHRSMGDLFLRRNRGARDQAEVSYRRAIERARAQEAKSWELRAATSLARLWRDQGKPAEAGDLLAPIYGWFTEGFGTADLKEAKGLLDELT